MNESKSSIRATANTTKVLWLLYIDSLKTTSSSAIKYADDLMHMPNSTTNYKRELQTTINEVTAWCDQPNNMIANPQESVIINFSNIHNHHVPPPDQITMQGETITAEDAAKFLGVTIDKHLTFKEHVDNLAEKTRKLIYTLLDLKRSGIPLILLRNLYIACIRPTIFYAFRTQRISGKNRKPGTKYYMDICIYIYTHIWVLFHLRHYP